MFDFTYHKPNSVFASSANAVIYLVPRLLAKSHPPKRRNIAALPSRSRAGRTRPCTRVRILPFHPQCLHQGSSRHCCLDDFFLSEKNVSVRTYWIAPYGRYPLPFISPTLRRRREFGLSSPDARSGETAQCKTTNIILCQTKMRKRKR